MNRFYTPLISTFFILVLAFSNPASAAATDDFVTLWDLSIAGSDPNQIQFGGSIVGNTTFSWETYPVASITGSGIISGPQSGLSLATITGLPTGAKIKLRLSATNLIRFYIVNGPDKSRLVEVQQWGTATWNYLTQAFYGCDNLQITATDVPDLRLVNDLSSMFNGCTSLNSPNNISSWDVSNIKKMNQTFYLCQNFNQDLSSWNVSSVTSMQGMFTGAGAFNQNIGNWNTSSLTNMNGIFQGATSFNQDISGWNTSKVNDMGYAFYAASSFNKNINNWNTASVTSINSMFGNATAFNQPLDNWNTSKVTDMSLLFYGASSFNQNLSSWNTTNVINMFYMFYGATAFNGSIGGWNTGNVTSMSSMFYQASNFNSDISNWNTANVTDMASMFFGCSAFNQNISNWNTSKVTNMSSMFRSASAFNSDISNWNTSNVTNMSNMFYFATSFNQNIGKWNISKVTNLNGTLYFASNFNQSLGPWASKMNPAVDLSNLLYNNSSLSAPNYDEFLTSLNATTLSGKSLNAANVKYCASSADRANLVGTKGWTITDGGVTTAKPTFPFGLTTTICAGTPPPVLPTISGEGFKGSWSPATVSPSVADTYTFTGACTSTTFTVSISGFAPTALVIPPVSVTSCSGTTVSFVVSATGTNIQYAWSDGISTTSSLNTSTAGTLYDVTITGACGLPVVSPKVSLTSIFPPAIVSQPRTVTVCGGSSTLFAVSATGENLTYTWSNGAPSINLMTTSTAGTYTVSIAGSCGLVVSNPAMLISSVCGSNATISSTVIIFPSTVPGSFPGSTANISWPTLSGAVTYCIRLSKSSTMSLTVKTVCGLNSANYLFVLSTSGLRTEATAETIYYQVAGVDTDGNMSQWSAIQSFDVNAGQPTEIASNASNSVGFNLYPNPASSGELKIEGNEGAQLQIFNAQGLLLLSQTLASPSSTLNTPLPSGIYLVKLGDETKKLVIE